MINSNFKVDVRYGEKNPATQEITWKSELDHNLINNNGLDLLSDYWATQCTENVYLESGGKENARFSGTILVEQNGYTVTSDNPLFTAEEGLYNRLIVFADGSQAGIESFIDSENVLVSDSKVVTAQVATIYYVEEVQMDGFVKASTTYETFGGAIDNTWSVASEVLTIVNKRTVSFPVEASPITYKGVGWTPVAGNDNGVFGRKVMDIAISAASQPIIEVTLTRKIDVSAVTGSGTIIAGVAESFEIMNMMGDTAYNTNTYWSSINASGVSVAPGETSTFMECKTDENAKVAIGDYSGALTLANIDISGSTYAATSVPQVYIPGNFFSDYIATFTPNEYSSATWNTIALINDADDTEAYWRLLFDNPVDFSNFMLRGLRIRKSWGRYYA